MKLYFQPEEINQSILFFGKLMADESGAFRLPLSMVTGRISKISILELWL